MMSPAFIKDHHHIVAECGVRNICRLFFLRLKLNLSCVCVFYSEVLRLQNGVSFKQPLHRVFRPPVSETTMFR